MRLSIQIAIVFALLLGCVSCNQDASKDRLNPKELIKNPNSANGGESQNIAVIKFAEDVHDFGNVMRGEKVSYSFKFTNIGGADLVISNVSAACGCTITDYPKGKIAPQESDYVTVTFDSSQKKGYQNKKVTILSNTQPSKSILRVKAKVIIP